MQNEGAGMAQSVWRVWLWPARQRNGYISSRGERIRKDT